MLQHVWEFWRWTLVRINHFDTEHWVMAFIGLLLIGFLSMQGLGSRKAH